jgi:hypothetical protein
MVPHLVEDVSDRYLWHSAVLSALFVVLVELVLHWLNHATHSIWGYPEKTHLWTLTLPKM